MKTLTFAAATLSCLWLLAASEPAIAETACLKKAPAVGDAELNSKGKPASVNAVTLAQDADLYRAKGFTVVDCPSVEKQAQFRESICAAAEQGNSYIRARMEKLFGESPARLCASARAAVSLVIKVPPPTLTLPRSTPPPSAEPVK